MSEEKKRVFSDLEIIRIIQKEVSKIYPQLERLKHFKIVAQPDGTYRVTDAFGKEYVASPTSSGTWDIKESTVDSYIA